MNDNDMTQRDFPAFDKTIKIEEGDNFNFSEISELRKKLGLKKYSDPDYYGEFKLLGKGGGGIVYEGFDYNLGRKVAVKVLRKSNNASLNTIERFMREARATAQLEHPNIIPIHHFGINENLGVFFTMKKIEGENLEQIIQKLKNNDHEYLKKYSLLHLIDILLHVCDGVSYAHSKGVMHRDLKPENIITGDFGEVLILDWGLVREFTPSTEKMSDLLFEQAHIKSTIKMSINEDITSALTIEGTISGTPFYMSPEQFLGKSQKLDQRSEVYTLGVILYFLQTLSLPYGGDTFSELLENILESRFIPPRRKAPERKIPKELEAIALKAMSLRPEDRYESVKAFQTDIQNYLDGFPVSAVTYSSITKFWKLLLRHKVLSVAVSAVLLTSILAIGIHQSVTYYKYHILYSSANQYADKSIETLQSVDALKVLSKKMEKLANTQDCDSINSECEQLEEKAQTDSKFAMTLLQGIPQRFKYSDEVHDLYKKLIESQIIHCLEMNNKKEAQKCFFKYKDYIQNNKALSDEQKQQLIHKMQNLMNK